MANKHKQYKRVVKLAAKQSEKQTTPANTIGNQRPSALPKAVRKPVYQTRQDIADWHRAVFMATAVDTPRQYLLQDIYNSVANDALLTSQINNRKEQTISAGFEMLTSEGKIDEKVTAAISEIPVMQDIISHILDSEYFGFSLIQLSSENGIKRVDLINRRNVVPDFGLYYPDTSTSIAYNYRELRDFGKYYLEFNSDHIGLFNKAVPHVLFKKFAQSCWSMLCEIYGIPPRVLKTNTQDPIMLDRAEKMMNDIGAAAWFIIDESEEFSFANSVNTTGDVYNNLIKLCDNYISMLITGAIIGQDTKNGNESKEKVSISILDRLVDSDKRMVEMYMNSVVIPAFVRLKWIPETSARFKFKVAEDTDKLFDMTVKIMPHMEIDPEFVAEKFGIKVLGNKNANANFQ